MDAEMDYVAWNRALIRRFLPPAGPGGLVYLSVSSDSLTELVDPSDSFVDAVRARYFTSEGAVNTACVVADLRWRARGEPIPPYVGLLALCALAASEMATDGDLGVTGSNYYVRLNRLLGRDGVGAPPGFEVLRDVWCNLDDWLSDPSTGRGASTITTHPTFVHVGYPISQTIFPARDRRRLPDFFLAAGLEPSSGASAQEVLHHLRRWARPGCGLRELTIARIMDPAWEPMISAIALAELQRWDGLLRDERGRVRADIVVNVLCALGGLQCDLYFWPRCPEGFPEEFDAGSFTLKADGDGWYQALEGVAAARALDQGLSLVEKTGRRSLTLERRAVVPLHQDLDSGLDGWAATRRIRLHEPLCLLVERSHVAEVERYLSAQGSSAVVSKPVGLPPGWALVRGARVSTGGVAPAGSSSDLTRILPRLDTTLAFDGGLSVSRWDYLVGEEPVVHLGLAEAGVMELDDLTQPMASGGLSLKLADLGLAEGDHRISVGPAVRRFRTLSGIEARAPAFAGRQAFVFTNHGHAPRLAALEPQAVDGPVGRGDRRLAGADIRVGTPGSLLMLREPILLRRAHDAAVIGGVPGEIEVVTPPPRDAWLDRISPTAGQQFYEAIFPFDPWFVIYRNVDGAWVEGIGEARAGALEDAPPRGARLGGEQELWSISILAVDTTHVSPPDRHADWLRMVAIAATLRSEGGDE